MEYPLHLRFKYWALAPQIYIEDTAGNNVLYVHQKLFRLRENIAVYQDKTKQKLLYTIKADRVIDFSAKYRVSDPSGQEICTIKQHGWKSLWRTHFEIFVGEKMVFRLREEDPWVKVADAVLSAIPFLDIFGGLVFHPSYKVMRVNADGSDAKTVMRLNKKPSFFERFFEINKTEDIDAKEEVQVLACLLISTLLERNRG
ncbi:MAG: hypothetical protein WCT32_00405 [Patescibacteria group bacterium]|jgi:uncharacterized protein YxjI